MKSIHFNGLSLFIKLESIDKNEIKECTNDDDIKIVTF